MANEKNTGMAGTEIYKRTATGAVQVWKQELGEDGSYRTIHGHQGGQLVVSEWTYCIPTNAGKKNERGPEAQAIFEVNANYKKKLERDYHLSPDAIDTTKIFEVMLANDYAKQKNKLRFPVFVQPKLDGMRCIAKADGLWSRNGKPIISTPHVWEDFQTLLAQFPGLILDGELYNHEYKEDFNSIISSAKKTVDLTPENLAKSAEVIEYHVYDIPSHSGDFHERVVYLLRVLSAFIGRKGTTIKLVPTFPADSHEEIDRHYGDFLALGYEGQIIRANTPYENKRTHALLKRKETITEEFTILEIREGVGNWAGKAKKAVVQTIHGESSVGIKGKMEHLAHVFQNRENYIGKPATVEYFGWTPDNEIRFGRVKEFARWEAE